MCVVRDGGKFFRAAWADERAVERVIGNAGQSVNPCRVGVFHRKNREPRFKKFGCQRTLQTGGRLDFSHTGLDGDFPDADDTHYGLCLGILHHVGGGFRQFRIVAQKSNQGAGIEPDPHWYSAKSSIRRLTMRGHEFIRSARNATVWPRVITEARGRATFCREKRGSSPSDRPKKTGLFIVRS